MAVNVRIIRDRMKELYVYDLYGLRTEIKPLSYILNPGEGVNCFLTGVMNGLRRMLAVTPYRIIIIGNHLGSSPDISIIPREDILSHSAEKRFFTSSVSFSTRTGARYDLINVSRRVLDVFTWAMDQPLPDPL